VVKSARVERPSLDGRLEPRARGKRRQRLARERFANAVELERAALLDAWEDRPRADRR
jgi:hypothetical protein